MTTVRGSQHMQPARSESGAETQVSHDNEIELDLDDSSSVAPRVLSSSTDTIARNYKAHNASRRSVQESHGSVVHDAGFSFEPPATDVESPPNQKHELEGLGTQFDHFNTDLDYFLTKDGKRLTSQDPGFIATCLRSKQEVAAHREDAFFIPRNQRLRILTYSNIYKELYRAGMRDEELETITSTLCRTTKDSLQRIFAILCMLDSPLHVKDIKVFIQERVFDDSLPFAFRDDLVYKRTNEQSNSEDQVQIRLFQAAHWRPSIRDTFAMYQNRVSAPFFKLSWRADEDILHFPLKDSTVLPFVRMERPVGDAQNTSMILTFRGGTSLVQKVKIHPAHHTPDPDGDAESDVYFAIKQLQDEFWPMGNGRKTQEDEVRALSRLHSLKDKHLIRLLATYEYRGHFHLILPWADGGNLRNLWEGSHLRTQGGAQNYQIAKWMSAQILGLARALRNIHYCPVHAEHADNRAPDGKTQEYGRHGDLKPENILWFKGKTDATSEGVDFGTLKIADFGFADFHSEHSRSNVRRSTLGGFTQTYSAPELDVSELVSPQYDIWSFGCIIIQFVVWYMEGWDGVEKFSKERANEWKGAQLATDTFFRRESRILTGSKASMKQSVRSKLERLKDDKRGCSDSVLDLLEYVQEHMLRVNKDKRADIDAIVQALKELYNHGVEDERYYTSRTKQAQRFPSDLSEIAELPETLGEVAIVDPRIPDPARQRQSHPSPHIRRSPSLNRYHGSTPYSRHGSLSSIVSAQDATRPRSNPIAHNHVYSDSQSPMPDPSSSAPDDDKPARNTSSKKVESLPSAPVEDRQSSTTSKETTEATKSRGEMQTQSSNTTENSHVNLDENTNGPALSNISEASHAESISSRPMGPADVSNGSNGEPGVPIKSANERTTEHQFHTLQLEQTTSVKRAKTLSQRWQRLKKRMCCS